MRQKTQQSRTETDDRCLEKICWTLFLTIWLPHSEKNIHVGAMRWYVWFFFRVDWERASSSPRSSSICVKSNERVVCDLNRAFSVKFLCLVYFFISRSAVSSFPISLASLWWLVNNVLDFVTLTLAREGNFFSMEIKTNYRAGLCERGSVIYFSRVRERALDSQKKNSKRACVSNVYADKYVNSHISLLSHVYLKKISQKNNIFELLRRRYLH